MEVWGEYGKHSQNLKCVIPKSSSQSQGSAHGVGSGGGRGGGGVLGMLGVSNQRLFQHCDKFYTVYTHCS